MKIERLKGLLVKLNKEPNTTSEGICFNYLWGYSSTEENEYCKNLLVRACEELQVYSGDKRFPIKSHSSNMTAKEAYLNCLSNKWNGDCFNGRTRIRVLEYMRLLIQEDILDLQRQHQRRNNAIKCVCVLFIVLVLCSVNRIHTAMVSIDAENACVKEHIALGFERKHILTDKGTCYVEE